MGLEEKYIIFQNNNEFITDNINELVIIINQEFDIEFVNNNPLIKALGYNDNELIGNSFLNYVYSEDLEVANNLLKNWINDKINIQKLRLMHKNGYFKTFEFYSKKPERSIYPDKILIVLKDITDKIKSERLIKESDEKFRSITEQSIIGVFIFQNGTFKYINQKAADIIGYTIEEILSWKEREIIQKIYLENREKILNNLRRSQEENLKVLSNSVFRVISKNGEIKWIEEYNKIIDFEGKSACLVILIDVTDKIESELKLKDSEIRYQELFYNSPVGILLFDENGNLLEVNTSVFNSFSGYPTSAIIGKNFTDIIPIYKNSDELMQIFIKRFTEMKKGKKLEPIEFRVLTQEGNEKWFHWQSSNVKLQNSSLIQVIIQDITERKLSEIRVKESEEKFRIITEQSLMGIALIQDGIVKYASERLANIYGYSIEEVLDWKPNEFLKTIDPEFLDFVKEQVKKKQLGDKDIITHYLHKIIKKTGEKRWVENYSKTINYKGRPADLVTNIDINELKETELKLKESEEKFRTIAEQSLLGLSIIQDGLIIFTNQALSNILEYSIEDMQKWSIKNILRVINEEDLSNVLDLLKKRKKDDLKSMLQFQCRIYSQSGCLKWVEVISKAIIYQGKIATILSLIDITEKKKVEEQLREISKLKSELLSRTSHELKTPLVSIKGYTDLLLSQHYKSLDHYTISILNEIKQGCNRLEGLIKDLLETSKLESKDIQLNKTEEDLSFLIRFCIKDIKGLLETRKHELILDIQDKMITTFEKERIYEIIMNLLSNAIKYTPPNGQISIKSEIKEKNYIISIKDNGIGLTKDEKEMIFKKFGKIERYGKGMNIISEGTGLGLYISKKIIELHGGKIWVESEGKDKGSTFYFSLPIIREKK
ncbi:MAG: PAS domain S-box protein [Promethearchaeota archaeon]